MNTTGTFFSVVLWRTLYLSERPVGYNKTLGCIRKALRASWW